MSGSNVTNSLKVCARCYGFYGFGGFGGKACHCTTPLEQPQRGEHDQLRTELGRAYRALAAYTIARDSGKPLPDHAVAYHSMTEAAAKRFVRTGSLEGSEYFIGKSVDVLHAALRGEEPNADATR